MKFNPISIFFKAVFNPCNFFDIFFDNMNIECKIFFFCLHTCVIWCIAHWRRCLEAHKWPSTGTYTKKSNNGQPLHTGFFALWNTVSLRWIVDILKSYYYYTVEIEGANFFKMFTFHPGHPVERNNLKILRFFARYWCTVYSAHCTLFIYLLLKVLLDPFKMSTRHLFITALVMTIHIKRIQNDTR